MTLVRFILQNIYVFWMHLFMRPMEICHKIDDIMARFIWLGTEMKGKIRLARWKAIARSIEIGGRVSWTPTISIES